MTNKKKANQSEQILNAAYNSISSKGYANVSLREIAKEAEVALSQLHYHFGSKEELFKEIIKKMMGKYLIEVEDHLRKGETEKEKMSSLIVFFEKILTHNSELFCLLYDLTGLALWSDTFRDLLSDLFKEISNMIEEFILNSNSLSEKLKGYSPKILSRMILGAMFGVGIQVLLDPNDKGIIDSLDAVQVIFQ